MIHPYDGPLLGSKKEQTANTPQKTLCYGKETRETNQYLLYDSIYVNF